MAKVSLESNKKSEFELRLYNHKTGDVVYKILTVRELFKVIECLELTVEGIDEEA